MSGGRFMSGGRLCQGDGGIDIIAANAFTVILLDIRLLDIGLLDY